jgi:hypothetical protein
LHDSSNHLVINDLDLHLRVVVIDQLLNEKLLRAQHLIIEEAVVID